MSWREARIAAAVAAGIFLAAMMTPHAACASASCPACSETDSESASSALMPI